MVKTIARRPDGSVILVMGISEGNVQRLKNGEPIYFDPAQLKIAPGTTIHAITLFYGIDEAALSRDLKALIGPDTDVIVVPRGDTRPQ